MGRCSLKYEMPVARVRCWRAAPHPPLSAAPCCVRKYVLQAWPAIVLHCGDGGCAAAVVPVVAATSSY